LKYCVLTNVDVFSFYRKITPSIMFLKFSCFELMLEGFFYRRACVRMIVLLHIEILRFNSFLQRESFLWVGHVPSIVFAG
jgi:hypothetical protein